MRAREHGRVCRLTRWAVVVALVLVPLGAAHALTACGFAIDESFDLQAAIDACYGQGGGTVNIPAGTFTFTSQIVLKSGVALQGAGVDQTILVMPARSVATNLLVGVNISNAAVRDLTIDGSVSTGLVYGIHIWNDTNVTVERVKTVNCSNGIKLDTQGTGFTLRDFTSRGDDLPLYVSNHTDSVFQRFDLADSTSHCMYVAANNHNLVFDDVKIVNPGKWGIQLWYDAGWETPSDNITLSDFDIQGRAALVIGRGYTNVTVSGLKITSTEYECVRLYDPHDVLIEDFTCAGGPCMLGTADSAAVPNAERVTLRNGTYSGTVLCEANIKITDLTIENVSTGATTTTTLASTTTTTQAPTTTTTLAPTTTTTQAPTTTTTVKTNPGRKLSSIFKPRR
jgi:Periplasmic copper-binding protein (NosD)